MGPKDSLLMKQEFDLQQTIRKILRDHTERKSFQSPVTFNEIQTPLVVRADSRKNISRLSRNIFLTISFRTASQSQFPSYDPAEVTISVKDEGLEFHRKKCPMCLIVSIKAFQAKRKEAPALA